MSISPVTRAAIARIWEQPQNHFVALFEPVGWWTGDLDEVEFLDRLYELDSMPSTDQRYSDARSDVIQHCRNNADWEGFWVVEDDRFGLADDTKLLEFLAETIHPTVRSDESACASLARRYNELLRRDGVELYVAYHISGRPVYAARCYAPLAPEIRDALATAIGEKVKAYDVAEFCTKIGLGPALEDYGDPMSSKTAYVKRHALHADSNLLLKAARATLVEFDDVKLLAIVTAAGGTTTGVANPPKNLIFAANGPKPELVLRDAISNDIEITKNAEFCLIYTRPITEEGVRWQDLIDWWADTRSDSREPNVERNLYRRMKASLSPQSPGELLILKTYGHLVKEMGPELPALIPQVYLHLDPRTSITVGDVLNRQRMDFLLLLPRYHRVVIEVDGKQHYSTQDGQASPALYGEMMAEDRRIRLRGYEVYRFGGNELRMPDQAAPMLRQFFLDLLANYGIGTKTTKRDGQ